MVISYRYKYWQNISKSTAKHVAKALPGLLWSDIIRDGSADALLLSARAIFSTGRGGAAPPRPRRPQVQDTAEPRPSRDGEEASGGRSLDAASG